jgi:hypothetical protein
MLQLASFLAACLLSLSWLVGTHYLPWVSWHSEAVAFLAVFLLGWGGLARVLRQPNSHAVALPLASVPFIGLSIATAIQGATGLVPFWGDVWAFCFYAALCVTCLSLGFAAALASVAEPDSASGASEPFIVLAIAILFSALASTVIAFAQVFGLWEHSDWIVRLRDLRRPGGNLAQPNHLATLLVMGVASLVFLHNARKIGQLASGLLLLLLSAGLAATESRTGALSAFSLLAWWLLKRRAIGDLTSKWVGVGAGAVLVGMFWGYPHLLDAMGLLSDPAKGRMLEGSLRLQVWPQLLTALAMHPWTGWGFHQVSAAHNFVVDAYPISEPYTYSHNLILDLALWFGVPIALLTVGAAALWFWRRMRAANQLLPWYGIAVALPLALHCMLEYPHAYAYFLAPVMFLIGAIEASAGIKPLARVGARPVAAMMLGTTVALAWSVVEYLKIEEDFRVARFQALRVGSPPPGYRQPELFLYDQLGVLLNDARITPSPHMSPEAMRVVKEAALHYPWSATQYRYAVSLALNGEPAEAMRQMEVIRRMWGEKVYAPLKEQMAELAATKYPVLQELNLP